jgi:beta-lactamase class A
MLQEIFDSVGARGFVHARDLGSGAETGLDADELVVLASVFKIPVLLELARRAAFGQLSLTERVRVLASEHAFGSTGTSAMMDDADLSLRDLAL